jgi:hypothetical protein
MPFRRNRHRNAPIKNGDPKAAASTVTKWVQFAEPVSRLLASLMSPTVSSMMVAGTKLGGNDRGGNSLNVSTKAKTSSTMP